MSAVRFQAELRKRLSAIANAADAKQQQAYMKSALPYFGVKSAPMRVVFRELFDGYAPASLREWRGEVLGLWNGAKHREEKYAALALCAHKGARKFQTFEALPLYEELIVTGAWWDLVDDIAAHRLSTLLVADRKAMSKAMRGWAQGEDMWLRRSSIICQLPLNECADLELLTDCVLPSLDSKEFFLRKAIGWALRQYAKKDAGWVQGFVDEHSERLSGLSKREALKHV